MDPTAPHSTAQHRGLAFAHLLSPPTLPPPSWAQALSALPGWQNGSLSLVPPSVHSRSRPSASGRRTAASRLRGQLPRTTLEASQPAVGPPTTGCLTLSSVPPSRCSLKPPQVPASNPSRAGSIFPRPCVWCPMGVPHCCLKAIAEIHTCRSFC